MNEQELDTIWNGLTLAAKRSWVQAMQPQPPAPVTPPVTALQLNAIVTEYVRRVKANTTPEWDAVSNVLDAIRLDGNGGDIAVNCGSRYDVASEMAETAADLGIPSPDVDAQPDEHDAYMDQLFDMLPVVAAKLGLVWP